MLLSLEIGDFFPLLLIFLYKSKIFTFPLMKIIYNRSIRIYPGVLELRAVTLAYENSFTLF